MHIIIFPRIVGMLVALLVLAVTYTPAVADFNAKWSALIEAARKDGKVVLNSVPGTEMRQKLPAAFKKKFGVTLECLLFVL